VKVDVRTYDHTIDWFKYPTATEVYMNSNAFICGSIGMLRSLVCREYEIVMNEMKSAYEKHLTLNVYDGLMHNQRIKTFYIYKVDH